MKKLITFSLFFSAIVISAYNPIGAQEIKETGIMDLAGKWVIPPIYDEIITPSRDTDIDTSFMTAVKDEHIGVIDIRNNILIPFKYRSFGKNIDGVIELKDENKKWGVMDKKGNIIIPFEYDYVRYSFGEEPTIVKKGEKYGCVDSKTGKEILPCKYNNVDADWDIIYVKNDLNRYALFDFLGKQLTDFKFSSHPRVFGVAPDKIIILEREAKKDSRGSYLYTFYDAQGKQLTPQYDEIFMDMDGSKMFRVEKGGKEGMLDSLAQTILPLEYDQIKRDDLINNKLPAQKNGKWGLVDTKNKVLIPFVYDDLYFIDLTLRYGYRTTFISSQEKELLVENRLVARKNGKWGIVDTENKEIIPFVYDNMHFIDRRNDGRSIYINSQGKEFLNIDNRLIAGKNGKWGIVDIENKEIIPFVYDDIFVYGKNICVEQDGRWSLINEQGKKLFEETYSEIEFPDRESGFNSAGELFDSHGNCLKVKKGEKWGLIDSLGTVLLPFEYDGINSFDVNDIFNVTIGDKEGIVKNGGDVLLPIEYDRTGSPSNDNNYFYAEKDGKKGIIWCSDYKVVYPFEYDEIELDDDTGIGTASKDEKWALIDVKNGKTLTEFIYDGMSYSPKSQTAITRINWGTNSWKQGLINKKGETILPPEYYIDALESDYFIVRHIDDD